MTKYIARAVALAVFCSTAAVLAADEAGKVPEVGHKAPDFTLNDLAGKPVTLSKLAAGKPVALVVLRGFPGYQCPICTFQVADLMKNADKLADAETNVLLVYPGPAENLGEKAEEFIRGKKLPEHFSYVTDPDYTFTNAYGLRWDAPKETAYPSTFVIGTDGVVRYAKVSKTHGGRAKADQILKSLNGDK